MFCLLLWSVVFADVYWVVVKQSSSVPIPYIGHWLNLRFACIQSLANDVFMCCGVSEFAKPQREIYI